MQACRFSAACSQKLSMGSCITIIRTIKQARPQTSKAWLSLSKPLSVKLLLHLNVFWLKLKWHDIKYRGKTSTWATACKLIARNLAESPSWLPCLAQTIFLNVSERMSLNNLALSCEHQKHSANYAPHFEYNATPYIEVMRMAMSRPGKDNKFRGQAYHADRTQVLSILETTIEKGKCL